MQSLGISISTTSFLCFFVLFCSSFALSHSLTLSLYFVSHWVSTCVRAVLFVSVFFYTHSRYWFLRFLLHLLLLPICLFTHATWIHSEREETFFFSGCIKQNKEKEDSEKKYILSTEKHAGSHLLRSRSRKTNDFFSSSSVELWFLDPVTYSFISCRSMHHTEGLFWLPVNNRYRWIYDNGCEPWPSHCWSRNENALVRSFVLFLSLARFPSSSPPVASYSTLIVLWNRLSDWGGEKNKLVLVLPPSINK